MSNNSLFNKQVDRNLKGTNLEKLGKISEAIIQYEKNISESFEGNFPYDRLSIIYRKLGKIDDEIRVLKAGISVFEQIFYRNDVPDKIKKFKNRLNKVEIEIIEKTEG